MIGRDEEDLDLQGAWDLAGRQDLTEEQVRLLLGDDRVPVLIALAQNPALSPETVQVLIDRGGELAKWAKRHPQASVGEKDTIAVREQTAYSLELYLEARQATAAQISAVSAALDSHSTELLGDVWRKASRG